MFSYSLDALPTIKLVGVLMIHVFLSLLRLILNRNELTSSFGFERIEEVVLLIMPMERLETLVTGRKTEKDVCKAVL
jgi:hypothetical protein